MRPKILADGGHDKVIWKRSKDSTRDKASPQRNSKTWWRRTTTTLLSVSLGSYRRRRRDVLMGRRGYVLMRRLGTVRLRRRWVFHLRLVWGVVETYWGDVVLRPHETSSQHTNKTLKRPTTEMSWQRSTETLLGVSFETYRRRRWDVQRDVVTTSPRRLVAGWARFFMRKRKSLKARIDCETFLPEHFMKYSFRSISRGMKYFHKILLLYYLNSTAYISHQ